MLLRTHRHEKHANQNYDSKETTTWFYIIKEKGRQWAWFMLIRKNYVSSINLD